MQELVAYVLEQARTPRGKRVITVRSRSSEQGYLEFSTVSPNNH